MRLHAAVEEEAHHEGRMIRRLASLATIAFVEGGEVEPVLEDVPQEEGRITRG